jgi:acyl carrier protein
VDAEHIKETVRAYLLNDFLPGEDPAALTDTTELVSTGILDSIAVLKVAMFLEDQFGVTLEAHEMGTGHLNTLPDIARLVMSKKA